MFSLEVPVKCLCDSEVALHKTCVPVTQNHRMGPVILGGTTVGQLFQPPCSSRVILEHISQDFIQITLCSGKVQLQLGKMLLDFRGHCSCNTRFNEHTFLILDFTFVLALT